MLEATLAADEEQRLADLHSLEVLDTPAEERFDRITRITQCHFDAPIVLISLVDYQRQWFKSSQGLAETETPRKISFCGHAILQESVFVVENTLLDPRFADNPLVTGEPDIRFYAGMPIKGPGGHKIGTLCVIDRQARQFGASDQRMLKDLAAMVESEMNALDLAQLKRQQDHEFSLLQSVMDSMSSTLSVRDNHGRYLFVNKEYELVHQRLGKDLIGKTVFDLFPTDAAKISHNADRKVIESGSVLESQSVVVQEDGEHIYQIIRTPLYRSSGEIYGVCVIGIDISQRLASEQKMRVGEDLLLSVMNSTSSLIAVRDLNSRYLFVNRKYEELIKMSGIDILGKTMEDIYPSEFAKKAREEDLLVFQSAESLAIDSIFPSSDGDVHFHSVRSPLLDRDGKIYGLCIVASDITQARRNEQALIENQRLLESLNLRLSNASALHNAILDVANFSIIATDTEGTIQMFSAGAEKILGYSADEVVGIHSPAIFHDMNEIIAKAAQSSLELNQTIAPGFEAFAAKVRQGGYDHQEWTYIRKDGSRLPVMLSLAALFGDQNSDANINPNINSNITSNVNSYQNLSLSEHQNKHQNKQDTIVGFLGIAYDLSEQKRMDKMKNEFISTVSHELRTPLTSIRGSLGLLSSGKLMEISPRAHDLFEIAKNNCERLVRLINDILDIAKMESGNMTFDLRPHVMQELVANAIAATQAYAELYQVKLELQSEQTPMTVLVDADRLLQVMINLLSNACKFSPKGGVVTIRLQALLADSVNPTIPANPASLRLSVIDNGKGVPEAFKGHIFEKFAQADSSNTRQKGGTGLGLSICKTIIEAHQGRIDFYSKPNEPTEFFFELPVIQ